MADVKNEIRKIIHIDMDAFYASVEQRDFPQWKGKPLVVGGSSERGVVAAASYEARKFGIRSAMPMVTARRKCGELIILPPRFDVYKRVSRQIKEIFCLFTDRIEPLSLDEAYLDVTKNKIDEPIATNIAKRIKIEIKENLNLNASAGVSYNKFLAKIASDMDKPDGLFIIKPDDANSFLDNLEVRKFFGVGKVTAKKMKDMGIIYGRDLKEISLDDLVMQFGKVGSFYYDIVRGVDNRPVESNRIRKSVGVENTFEHDLINLDEIMKEFSKIEEELVKRMKKNNIKGKTLTLKVKYENFEQITRSKTKTGPYTSLKQIHHTNLELFTSIELNRKIRLLGLALSNFEKPNTNLPEQLEINF